MWGPAIMFLTYWLNAANSDPTSWKCLVVRGPHRCHKIPALVSPCSQGTKTVLESLIVTPRFET
jgi:hypothetical protein